jgi:hypothetical protein
VAPSSLKALDSTNLPIEYRSRLPRSLAESLAEAIDPVLGWYCDFRTDDDTFVVFSEKVFRYQRGHPEGRGEAAAYARLVGVPESQIDWPE